MSRLIVIILVACSLILPACKKDTPTARSTVGTQEASFEKLVKKHVEDKGRRDRLLLMVDENRRTFADIKFAFIDITDKLRADPQLTREEAERIFGEFNQVRDDMLVKMVARRLEMREYTTEEEWNSIHADLEKQLKKSNEKQENN